MKYLLMIYGDESIDENMSDAELESLIGEYQSFSEGIVASGNFLGGEALLPSLSASCLKIEDEKVIITDGPFIETKEQLGGYYLIEATDIDEARIIASKIPNAKTGTIEIRPVMVFE